MGERPATENRVQRRRHNLAAGFFRGGWWGLIPIVVVLGTLRLASWDMNAGWLTGLMVGTALTIIPYIRSYVRMGQGELIVQNPLRRYSISFADVARFEVVKLWSSTNGVRIILGDGGSVVAIALTSEDIAWLQHEVLGRGRT